MSEYRGTDNLEMMAEAINYNRFLLSLVRTFASKTDLILDIGAGIGTFANELQQTGYTVSCVEPDVHQAKRIRELGIDVRPAVEEFTDASFDLIYALNVLEHIDDDCDALRRWREKLKPNGKLLLYVPAFQVLYSSMDRRVGHFRRYSRAELVRRTQQAGFHVIQSRYVDCLGFLATLVFKCLGSASGEVNASALALYDRFAFPVSRAGDMLFSRLVGKNVVVRAVRK